MEVPDIFKTRFVRNSLARLLMNLILKLTSLVLVVAIARFLGPAALGEYTFVIYLAVLLAIVMSAGVPSFISKELPVAERKGRLKELFSNSLLLLELSSLLILLLGIPATVIFFNRNEKLLLALSLASVYVLSGFFERVFVGRERQQEEIPWFFLREILRLVLGLLGLYILYSYMGVVDATFLAYLVFSIALFFYFRKLLVRAEPKEILKILSRSVYYLFFSVVGVLLVYTDSLLLYMLSGATSTGYYRVATSIVTAVLQIFPFTVVTLPALSRRVSSGESVGSAVKRYLTPLLSAGLLFQFATILLGAPVIYLLFGEKYLIVYPVLALFSAMIPLRSLYYYIIQAVIVAGGEKIQAVFPFVGLLVNVALDLALIPSFGMIGAAAASLVSILVSAVLASVWLLKNNKRYFALLL